ncbi:MAG: TetR/AcrR family transcriptional regulator [Candidatus Binataceae bacterium]
MPTANAHKTRDPDAVKVRILAAARAEFSAKGLAGARVDAIARRARINKRMLYYYFGDKRGLYRQSVAAELARRVRLLAEMPDNLDDAIVHFYERIGEDMEWMRMMEWEALGPWRRQIDAVAERKVMFSAAIEKIRRGIEAAGLPADADPAQLLLSFVALAAFPIAAPQMVFLLTGKEPTETAFRQQRMRLLRWMGRQLFAANGATPVATAKSAAGK